ncbi:AfsA-related hotdog domain-containing protein [Brevibacterium sp. HMSC063G07]|uniref:AfsA-related hotdog domain-containing protein n=1 Tax=Brevibacterium sp. HMSC063G07 TaxID=1739261 RepID=UPI0008A3C051|nr:AfsA-related hotdog domain-containing protein [Brevibacterium sp. HMSC063G07]OFL64793.1 hypothetical protein HMPREF2757_05845 [Brevibacterium sp. HMSC063G07]
MTTRAYAQPVNHAEGPDPMTRVTQHETHKRNPFAVWTRTARLEPHGGLTAAYSIPGTVSTFHLSTLMEVQRQAGIVHVHRGLGIPYDHVFVLDLIELRLHEHVERIPVSGIVNVTVTNSDRGARRRLDQEYTIVTQDGRVAKGRTRARFIPRPVYERLRQRNPIGTPDHGDRDLESPEIWHDHPFVIDDTDPILSDHASDHVSAMSVVCALERILGATTGEPQLRSLQLEFLHYTELEPRSIIRLQKTEGDNVAGRLMQDGVGKAAFAGTRVPALAAKVQEGVADEH